MTRTRALSVIALLVLICVVPLRADKKIPTGTLDLNPGSILVYGWDGKIWFDYTVSGGGTWAPRIEMLCYQNEVLIWGDSRLAKDQGPSFPFRVFVDTEPGDPSLDTHCVARLTVFARTGQQPGTLYTLDTAQFDILAE